MKEVMNLHIEQDALEALRQIKDRTGQSIQWQIRKAIDRHICANHSDECGHDEAKRKGGQSI